MPRKRAATRKQTRGRKAGLLAAVAVVLAAGLALAVWFALRDGESPTVSAQYTGTESAGGVEVLRPSVDLGRQPLDQPVSHTFVLTNTNDRPVELGKAKIKVLDGC
ncbi:MAG TPA: hypothetical protein VIH05_05920 [Tepidiformaceae bacterium]|jgi:hypothetical protein